MHITRYMVFRNPSFVGSRSNK